MAFNIKIVLLVSLAFTAISFQSVEGLECFTCISTNPHNELLRPLLNQAFPKYIYDRTCTTTPPDDSLVPNPSAGSSPNAPSSVCLQARGTINGSLPVIEPLDYESLDIVIRYGALIELPEALAPGKCSRNLADVEDLVDPADFDAFSPYILDFHLCTCDSERCNTGEVDPEEDPETSTGNPGTEPPPGTTTTGNPVDRECGSDGTWTKYKDEKCFKILDKFVPLQEARELCIGEIGLSESEPLITIRSYEEQQFISNLVFQNFQIVDNVWLDALRQDHKNQSVFIWSDGSSMEYTNWNEQSPSDDPVKNCVHMLSGASNKDWHTSGLWSDVSCLSRNLVVCQKHQMWTSAQLQKSVIRARNELKNLKANPVPLDFLYVQLGGQPEPQVLWSTVEWSEMTEEYAGLFFRAAGGQSDEFGKVQPENFPNIKTVQCTSSQSGEHIANEIDLKYQDDWSPYIWIGTEDYGYNGNETLRFYTSGGETRPINSAIRLWKRTA